MAHSRNTRTPGFRPVANRALHDAMHALASSSAASRHQDARSQRARTRQAAKARAIADYA